jgi:hypothetical protein
MPPSGGTSSSTTNTAQQSSTKTQPWKPTIPALNTQIAGITGEQGAYKPTANETAALNQITGNAQAGNPYLPQIQGLAGDLLGGGENYTDRVKAGFDEYKMAAQPFLSPDYLDPSKNQHFNAYTTHLADNAANRVNSMFAGAGRDFSGANMKALGQGITEATLPVYANQYNQNVATQRGMMDNLYNANNQSTGVLSGLDQTAFNNRFQGVNAAESALTAQNYGPESVLRAEAMRRGLPLQNLSQLNSLLLPIAGLGGQTQASGTNTTTGTTTMSPVQQAMSWSQAFSPFLPKVTFTGTI